MKSPELYRILKRALGPGLKALGFAPAPGGSALWVLPLDGQFLFLSFVGNKWGWSEPFGSDFAATVFLSRVPDYKARENCGPERLEHPGRTEILEFLDDEDIAAYCRLRNIAIDKGLARHPTDVIGMMGDVANREGKALEKDEPPSPYTGVTFPWLDEADVEAWATFFLRLAARMPARMRELGLQSREQRRRYVGECWKRADTRSEDERAAHRTRKKAATAASIAAFQQMGAALESTKATR